jgi:hypothetical protein
MGYIKKPELPRPQRIKRTCLKCGQEFVAEGRFNRICRRCTESNRRFEERFVSPQCKQEMNISR